MNRRDRRRQKKQGLPREAAAPNKITARIPSEKLGPSGIPGRLVIVPKYPGDTRSDSERLQDRSTRPIKISATLSKTPSSNEDYRFDITADDGASYLLAPAHASSMIVTTSLGDIQIKKNQAGELSFLEFECSADSIDAARTAFRRAVSPFLDHLSYVNNCPMFLGTVVFSDPKNDHQNLDYVGPYRKSLLKDTMTVLFESMRPVYSMYREAANSPSIFYKFLCYYKIIEGLTGRMRADLFKSAREKRVEISPAKLLVPDHAEMPEHMRQHVGRSVKEFFDTVLTPKFRNATAHFVADDGNTLDVSEPEFLDSYVGIILISELCVRAVIADHEALLQELG